MTDLLQLVPPSRERVPQYAAALKQGWSPNNLRDVSEEQLTAIGKDPEAFLRDLISLDVPVILPDGRQVPRLPFHVYWLWDGEFCGSASLRFQRGTEELPPHVTGHIGYAVVPWKRGRGYASKALTLLLPIARSEGLARVMVTCDDDNPASERVILKNRGTLASRGPHPFLPGKAILTFWINTPVVA
jgi:predicted acetyltransferase